VEKTGDMRGRARAGEPIASIARHIGVSEPTAGKYARMVDLSPEPPSTGQPESEVLARTRGRSTWLQELAQAVPNGHEGVRQAP
jgi:hypothetical protein